jgi:hypothetical protein
MAIGTWASFRAACLNYGAHQYPIQIEFPPFWESVFGSVVAGAFQIAFRAEMHVNNFFLKKKSFLTSAHQNNPKNTNRTQF